MTKAYDLTDLQELSGGSQEFVVEIITVFLNETPVNLENLERFCATGNFEKVEFLAHKMKSSFGLLGMATAHRIASQMEQAGKNLSKEGLVEMMAELKEVATTGMDAVKAEL